MIIDTSALVAILMEEAGYERFYSAILDRVDRRISAASVVELVVCYRAKLRFVDPYRMMIEDLAKMDIAVAPVTVEQAMVACEARLRYGKAPAIRPN